mgnify:CR=1 FL=1
MYFFEFMLISLGVITVGGTFIMLSIGSYHVIRSIILGRRMKKMKQLLSYFTMDDNQKGIEMTSM